MSKMTVEPGERTRFVQVTLGVLGGKWKLLILWHIRSQPRRFSELKRLIPQISEKILIQQLRALEKDEIIHRNDHAEVPPRVDYSFTEHGESLKPVLETLCKWGEAHLKQTEIEMPNRDSSF